MRNGVRVCKLCKRQEREKVVWVERRECRRLCVRAACALCEVPSQSRKLAHSPLYPLQDVALQVSTVDDLPGITECFRLESCMS
jgi:hypothetical protein